MARKYRGKRMRSKMSTKRNIVKKALQKATTNRIKKVVKSVMNRQVETKVVQTSGTLFPRTIDATATQLQFNAGSYCLTPQGATQPSWVGGGYPIIGLGVGQDQRVGDEIKIKAHYFDYQILPRPYNVSTNPTPSPQILLLFFVKPKVRAVLGLDVAFVQSGSNAIFYENQANTDSGMSGTLFDLLRKIDRDNFQVLAIRQHKIGYSGALNTSNSVATFQNNDFKSYVRGRVKLGSSICKFDRNDFYENRNIFLIAYTIRADGVAQSPSLLPIDMVFNHTIYYQDP